MHSQRVSKVGSKKDIGSRIARLADPSKSSRSHSYMVYGSAIGRRSRMQLHKYIRQQTSSAS
jgi:hypothetical protein